MLSAYLTATPMNLSKSVAISGLGIWALWLCAEYFALGPASVVPTSTNGEIIVPALLGQRFFAADALWQTQTSSGTDKSILTYYGRIDSLLFATLPGWMAHALRVSSVIVGGIAGSYLLARSAFGFSRLASLCVSAAYSVPIQGHLLAGVTGYLPFVLLGLLHTLDDKRRPIHWIGLAAALYIIADTTYFSQLLPWVPAAIVFWFLFASTRTSALDWVIILGSCLALFLLRMEHISALFAYAPLSAMEYARDVPDIEETLRRFVLQPYFLSKAVWTTSLVLFIVGFLSRVTDNRQIRTVGLALLISPTLYPLAVSIQVLAADIFTPLRGYRMGYIHSLPALLLPFAGGYGIEALCRLHHHAGRLSWLQQLWRWAGWSAVVSVLLVASLQTKYANLYNWMTNGSYVANFQSSVIQAFADKLRAEDWPIRAETFQIIPNYLSAYNVETAGGYQAVHTKRYYEFWAKMAEPWASSLGPDSRFYAQYAERRQTMKGDMAFRDDRLWLFPDKYQPEWQLAPLYRLNFLSLANVGYFVSREKLTDPSLQPIREMPRPWSALSQREKATENFRANFLGRQHLYIYRNTDVLPRFFTVSSVDVVANSDLVLDAIAAREPSELRTRAIVARGDLPPEFQLQPRYAERRISLDGYTPSTIRLTLGEGDEAVLVVTNSFSPFWTVEIDGVPGTLFPAFHAFWGVHVPKDARSVVFKYRSPYIFSGFFGAHYRN